MVSQIKHRKVSLHKIWMIFLFGFATLLMFYQDGTVGPRFGLYFLDSLFDGKPFSFYGVALQAGINEEGANYDIGFYLLYGLWELPIWIFRHFAYINETSPLCLIWYKLLPVLFLFHSAKLIRDIAELLGFTYETQKVCSEWYLFSPLTFFPIFVACQCDIIPLTLCLAATKYWMKGDFHKPLILFACAMLTKPFAIFWLLLYCIMENRKILQILGNFLFCVFPMLIFRFLYYFSPSFPAARRPAKSENISLFLDSSVPLGSGALSLFVFTLLILYLYAWMNPHFTSSKTDSKQAHNRSIVFLLWSIWLSFILFVGVAPYWIIYFAPFSILILPYCHDSTKAAFLDLTAGSALILHFIFIYPWVYGGSMTYGYSFLSRIASNAHIYESGITLAGVLRTFRIDRLLPAITALYTASWLICGSSAIINTYKKKQGSQCLPALSSTSNGKHQTILRLCALTLFVLVTLATWYLSIKYRSL